MLRNHFLLLQQCVRIPHALQPRGSLAQWPNPGFKAGIPNPIPTSLLLLHPPVLARLRRIIKVVVQSMAAKATAAAETLTLTLTMKMKMKMASRRRLTASVGGVPSVAVARRPPR